MYIFIIYNFVDNLIEAVLNSKSFLDWLLENDGVLRRCASEDPHSILPSYSDCHHTRSSLLNHLQPLSGSKLTNTIYKAMFTLPYSPQSMTPNPLLSPEFFRFSDKFIGREMKWRTSPDYAIRFIRRGYGNDRLAFAIDSWADQPTVTSFSMLKRYHSICWHPYLPFLIVSHQSALRSTSIIIKCKFLFLNYFECGHLLKETLPF
jgi:hypothetical protein